jgi:hypothetical protein
MNFLYLYPTYQEAREAFDKKVDDLAGQLQGVFIRDLIILATNDCHKFNYVPIRVHVDLERLGIVESIVCLQPLIEELCNQVRSELVKLNDFVVITTGREHERARRGSASSLCVQAPDAPPSGGTGDASALKLGAKITSGPAVLQGRLDL